MKHPLKIFTLSVFLLTLVLFVLMWLNEKQSKTETGYYCYAYMQTDKSIKL